MNKKTHPKNRLHEQIGQMISLESAIEQKLGELIPEVSAHTAASALLTSFLSLPRDPRLALENRLHTLSEEAPQIISPGSVIVPGTMNEGENHPVSAALQLAHTIFIQAVIGYAVLVPLGTRFLDSSFIADQGTLFHLAKQHMQNCAQAIQQITHLLHDVLLWELDSSGFECHCLCPSCSAGICLCSIAGRLHLSIAWDEAGPIFEDGTIKVQLPKQASVAANAGLQKGDVILAVGDQEIDSFSVIQGALRNAEPGEELKLQVRRCSNEIEEVVLVM